MVNLWLVLGKLWKLQLFNIKWIWIWLSGFSRQLKRAIHKRRHTNVTLYPFSNILVTHTHPLDHSYLTSFMLTLEFRCILVLGINVTGGRFARTGPLACLIPDWSTGTSLKIIFQINVFAFVVVTFCQSLIFELLAFLCETFIRMKVSYLKS